MSSLSSYLTLYLKKKKKGKRAREKNYGYSVNYSFNQISKLELFTSNFSILFVGRFKWSYKDLHLWCQYPPSSPHTPPTRTPHPHFCSANLCICHFLCLGKASFWPCLPGKARSSFKNQLEVHLLCEGSPEIGVIHPHMLIEYCQCFSQRPPGTCQQWHEIGLFLIDGGKTCSMCYRELIRFGLLLGDLGRICWLKTLL